MPFTSSPAATLEDLKAAKAALEHLSESILDDGGGQKSSEKQSTVEGQAQICDTDIDPAIVVRAMQCCGFVNASIDIAGLWHSVPYLAVAES